MKRIDPNSPSSPGEARLLANLLDHAHQRLDRLGVDRRGQPVPWHIARDSFLSRRSRRHPHHLEAHHA